MPEESIAYKSITVIRTLIPTSSMPSYQVVWKGDISNRPLYNYDISDDPNNKFERAMTGALKEAASKRDCLGAEEDMKTLCELAKNFNWGWEQTCMAVDEKKLEEKKRQLKARQNL